MPCCLWRYGTDPISSLVVVVAILDVINDGIFIIVLLILIMSRIRIVVFEY